MAISFFFVGILPCIEYFIFRWEITLNSNLRISWLTNTAVLYQCIGYFLQNRLSIEKEKRLLPYLWTINIFLICMTCYMTYIKGINEGGGFFRKPISNLF